MSNSSSAPPPLRTPSAGGGLRTASMAEDGKRACSDGSTVSAATERSYFDVDKPTSGGAAPASAVVALTGGGAAPASAVVALTGGGAATLDWAYVGQAVPLSSLIDTASARAPSMSGGNSSAVAVVGGVPPREALMSPPPPPSAAGGPARAASVGGAAPQLSRSMTSGGAAPQLSRSMTSGGAFAGNPLDMSFMNGKDWGDFEEEPLPARSASAAPASEAPPNKAEPRSASAPAPY